MQRQKARSPGRAGKRQKLGAEIPSAYCLLPSACSVQRGITLIDTVVGSALMLLVFVGPAANFGFAERNFYG